MKNTGTGDKKTVGEGKRERERERIKKNETRRGTETGRETERCITHKRNGDRESVRWRYMQHKIHYTETFPKVELLQTNGPNQSV